MLEDLLAHDGVEERCELRSRFGFMAFHGGNLERGTDQIALEAARRADASIYAVVQPPDLRWHVPSLEFRPERSARLARFVAHVDVAVAVHGYGRHARWTTLLVGGRHRPLAATVAAALQQRLGDGFVVVDDLEDIPRELRGLHRRNPVNLPRLGGVQLELPPRVRAGTGAPTYDPAYGEAIVVALAAVARQWVIASTALSSRVEITSSTNP